jgi:diadenylate cyclase
VALFVHAIDILLVAIIFYKILSVIRGTRAWRILWAIILFVFALFLSKALHLDTLRWVLDKATLLGPVALVILLLPELRQALESFGKLGGWTERLGAFDSKTASQTIEEIVAAVTEMSAGRVGALIVVEQAANLDEIVNNGVRLDAKVSAPLLSSVFYGANPLHDGAVVIRRDTVVAAACRLPLSENSRLDSTLHMRHRAAVGVTESLDCLSIVVSEERGVISIATNGKLKRLANPMELRETLNRELRNKEEEEEAARKARAAKSRRRRK